MTDPRPIGLSLPAATERAVRSRSADLPPEVQHAKASGLAFIYEARWSAVIPARLRSATFDEVLDEVARRRLVAWSIQERPANLILLGPVGVGKTSAAVAAVRPAFDRSGDVAFAPVKEMLELLRPDHDSNALAEFCGAERLIIDDLGAERQTEWTTDQIGLIVNRRWMDELPTVVTANLTQRDLEAHLGAHTADRLFGNGAVVIVMTGPSRRR